MSLHARCVRQHPDSLRKITSVLDREKLPVPGVLYFPPCYLLRVGDFSCGQHGCCAPAIRPHTDLLADKQPAPAHTVRLSLLLFQLSPFSLSHSGLCSCLPYTVSDSTCLYPCLHLTPRFFFPQACSLPRYLSLCQGPNVGLQMKQLDFHLRLPGINMCCSLSGRTLSASPMLSQERMGKQMKRLQLLARKRCTKADIIQLFSARIYYIIWAANNSDKITWL